MTMGGIAHGIGAALYEEFAYNDDGLLVAQSFMDYLAAIPPTRCRRYEIVHPRDAVAAHRVRPEGLRPRAAISAHPQAVASAVNDAVRPLGIVVSELPIKVRGSAI